MDQLAPMMAMITILLVIGWIWRTSIIAKKDRTLAGLQADLQKELIARFESPAQITEYLESAAGRQLLESPASGRGTTYGRLLGSIQIGTILATAGLAFYFLRGHFEEVEVQSALAFLGGIAASIGIGYLLSALVAWKLSKNWGLLDARPEDPAR